MVVVCFVCVAWLAALAWPWRLFIFAMKRQFSVVGVAVGCIMFFCISRLILTEVNKYQAEPYMDEIFHVAQTQRYCAGRYSEVKNGGRTCAFNWNNRRPSPTGTGGSLMTSMATLSSTVCGLSKWVWKRPYLAALTLTLILILTLSLSRP